MFQLNSDRSLVSIGFHYFMEMGSALNSESPCIEAAKNYSVATGIGRLRIAAWRAAAASCVTFDP